VVFFLGFIPLTLVAALIVGLLFNAWYVLTGRYDRDRERAEIVRLEKEYPQLRIPTESKEN